jgi:hypothetical protein
MKAWRRHGGHAHKECWQAIICLEGLVIAKIRAIGDEKSQVFLLNQPTQCLVVPSGYFIVLENDREATVILVLCSEDYDRAEYIVED